MTQPFDIFVGWDAEAQVWYVTDSSVPGLATEADTLEALVEKVRMMVLELLELNDHPAALRHGTDVPIHVHADRLERIRAAG